VSPRPMGAPLGAASPPLPSAHPQRRSERGRNRSEGPIAMRARVTVRDSRSDAQDRRRPLVDGSMHGRGGDHYQAIRGGTSDGRRRGEWRENRQELFQHEHSRHQPRNYLRAQCHGNSSDSAGHISSAMGAAGNRGIIGDSGSSREATRPFPPSAGERRRDGSNAIPKIPYEIQRSQGPSYPLQSRQEGLSHSQRKSWENRGFNRPVEHRERYNNRRDRENFVEVYRPRRPNQKEFIDRPEPGHLNNYFARRDRMIPNFSRHQHFE